MKRAILIISAIVLLLALSGCDLFTGGSGAELNGTSWTLESYGGKNLISGSTMTAIFEAGEVSGSASCNHYFGSFQTKGDQITIEGLGWTEMACMDPEGIMEQESAIMSMLGKSASYLIEGSKLEIRTESGEDLVFVPLDNE